MSNQTIRRCEDIVDTDAKSNLLDNLRDEAGSTVPGPTVMSTGSFSFPPPPPPPPPQQPPYDPQLTSGSNFSRGRGNRGWERGSRGRGRGNSQRGFRGGGQHYGFNPSQSAGHSANNSSLYGGGRYPLPQYPPLPPLQYQSNPPNPQNSYYSTHDTAANQMTHQRIHSYYQPENVSQHTASSPFTFPDYSTQSLPIPDQYSSFSRSNQRYASPSVAMGQPGMEPWSFSQNQNQYPNPGLPHHSFDSRPLRQYGSQDNFRPDRQPTAQHRGGRFTRGFHSTRGSLGANPGSTDFKRKTEVAPAVPSFGIPLPTKPPVPEIEARKPKKKKKRRVNQLGLTPKTEDHVSSSEEEDEIDEEAKLARSAVASGGSGQQLQFTYKGHTSTLQDPSDIASWIEQRKKRFPTAARQAEKENERRRVENEKKTKREALHAEKAAGRQRVKEEKQLKREAISGENLLEGQKRTPDKHNQAAADKAKLKVEKLREKLRKEERRAAKAEAKSLKRNIAAEDDSQDGQAKRIKGQPGAGELEEPAHAGAPLDVSGRSKAIGDELPSEQALDSSRTAIIKQEPQPSLTPGPLTPMSQPAIPDSENQPSPKQDFALSNTPIDKTQTLEKSRQDSQPSLDLEVTIKEECPAAEVFRASSDTLTTSDEESSDDSTSSSGSDSSSSDSDPNIEGPESAPSRREGPQKVMPVKKKRTREKPICRNILNTGHCGRGNRCRFRHELPGQGKRKAEEEMSSRSQRKSLHQRLVEQEIANEKAEKAKVEDQNREKSI
ncbi:MAG: hypothetical protein Q9174_001682 [Haloplaca sp. 1 TL-2023]